MIGTAGGEFSTLLYIMIAWHVSNVSTTLTRSIPKFFMDKFQIRDVDALINDFLWTTSKAISRRLVRPCLSRWAMHNPVACLHALTGSRQITLKGRRLATKLISLLRIRISLSGAASSIHQVAVACLFFCCSNDSSYLISPMSLI